MNHKLPSSILLSAICISIFLFGWAVPDAYAQNPAVEDAGTETVFGQKIIFRAALAPSQHADEVLVAFTPEGQAKRLEKMVLNASGTAEFEVPVNPLDFGAGSSPLRLAPFTQIRYYFEVHLQNGEKAVSPDYQILYEDTRFTWNTLEEGMFEVHWNSGDSTFGQDILNMAQSGLDQAQSYLQADPPDPLRIYAYNSAQDLQEALMTSGESWTAGHASPELGMILVSIPPGPEKDLELQRQITHEIMHLLQYQVTGPQFARQPVWLLEGMASIAEPYPNTAYRPMLENSSRSDNFIPMLTLCQTFPDEAGAAFRAYAQSESFVRFLHSIYGTTGLRELMGQYQNGLSCNEAVSAVFGTSLGQLEYRWKQEVLGLNAGGLAIRRLSPYLLVGLVLFVPALFSFWPLRAGKRSTGPGGQEQP